MKQYIFNTVPRRVIDLFEDAVERFPNQIGIVYGGGKFRYSEINDRVNQLVSYLNLMGVSKGDFVGVLAEKSEHLVFSILAIMKIGGVYVPITPNYPVNRIKYILEDAKLPFVIVDRVLMEQLHDIISGAKILALPLERPLQYETPCQQESDLAIDDNDLTYLFYTSGSTGNPKGVLIHQAGFLNRILWQKEYFNMTPDERCLFKSPIGFDISLWEIFLPLISGATLVISKEDGYMDINYLTDLIIKEEVAISQFVPSLLRIFINKIKDVNIDSDIRLKRVVSSGEELTPHLVNKFYETFSNANLYNFYGPTETSICVTAKKLERHIDVDSYVSLGEPINNVNIYLLDDAFNPIHEDGVKGEVFVSGICVGQGYLNLPELTKESFLPNHLDSNPVLYRTGDSAKFINKELVYIGRKDRTIKINGNRVDLGEIETQLNRLPYIELGFVKVCRKKSGAKIIVAFYKPLSIDWDAKTTEKAILSDLKLNLPSYMLLHLFIAKEDFQLTHNGKVDLSQLIIIESNMDKITHGTNGYQFIHDLFNHSLGFEVKTAEDFLELGGSSIEAIEILEKINKQYHVALSFAKFMGNFTIQEVVRAIELRL